MFLSMSEKQDSFVANYKSEITILKLIEKVEGNIFAFPKHFTIPEHFPVDKNIVANCHS